MNEYIKKHKVTLLMLLIVMLLVSCLVIPAYAYDLGGGLYCGINLFNRDSYFFKDSGVSFVGNKIVFKTNSNTRSFLKMQLRNKTTFVRDIMNFTETGTYNFSFNLDNHSNAICIGINGDNRDSLLVSKFAYPVGKYYIRFVIEKNITNEIVISDLMVTSEQYNGLYEPYFQNYSGTAFPLNVVNKSNKYTAMIGYYALPRPLPSNINVSFFVEGIDKYTFNTDEMPHFNIGFTRTASLSYIFSNDFVSDADFYSEIPLSALTSYVINDQLINDYNCYDMTYIVLDFSSGDTSDIARVQRAVIDGDIKGYIRVNSMNADYQGAYSDGYGAGIKDGYDIKQSDSLAIFPSFFGAIADFFKKFSSIEIFGITLGTVVATVVIIGVTISLYKMFR